MMGKSNIAGLQVNALSIRIKVPCSQAGSFQTGVPSVLLTPSQSSLWGGLYWVHFPQQQFWPKYVTVNCYIFLNLAWHWSLAVLSSCVGRCVLPLCARPCPAEGLRAHTHLRVSGTALFCTPSSSQGPVLPTASFVWLFFPPTSFFLSFFPPFLLTHMHKALFISHPAPSVLSPSRSSLFLLYINSNPLPWKLGWRVRFQYCCFETNLLGFVMDEQMLAE